MPRQINLKEIADRNTNVDLRQLEEWRKLRAVLSGRKRYKDSSTRTSKRAQLVDDEKNDPRLVKLQRNR